MYIFHTHAHTLSFTLKPHAQTDTHSFKNKNSRAKKTEYNYYHTTLFVFYLVFSITVLYYDKKRDDL
jgi:hypothetical protein